MGDPVQGGAVVARSVHTREVDGANPSPASSSRVDPKDIHRAAAQYWGLAACWHYQLLAIQRTDARAAKAETLALVALNHAWSVVGREHEGTGTRGVPGG